MNWLGNVFKGNGQSSISGGSCEVSALEEIFPLSLACGVFVESDILATYTRILTDAAERTHGLRDEQWKLLWDSCVQSQSSQGLIALLADAMLNKSDLFIVYVPSVSVLRRATSQEERQIRDDYVRNGNSKVGVFVSFRNYRKTDMLRVFSEMEFCVISSLYKAVNISKSVQVKVSDLRSSVSLNDSGGPMAQARAIAAALRSGKDVATDAKDSVTTSTPDIGPTKEAIGFLDGKRAFHLNLPLAYISGLQTGGIGASGDADARAIDRGLKPYFISILQPVLEEVFGVDVDFRPEDQRQVEAGLEVLKAFDLVSNNFLSADTMRTIVARAFDVDPIKEADLIAKEEREREETPRSTSDSESPRDDEVIQ